MKISSSCVMAKIRRGK